MTVPTPDARDLIVAACHPDPAAVDRSGRFWTGVALALLIATGALVWNRTAGWTAAICWWPE